MSKVTNEHLTRELANCRAALKPFAAALKRVDRGGPDEAMFIGAGLSLGDLRAARAALEAVSSIHEAEPDEVEMKWRDLALQFDGHRMEALGLLRALDKVATSPDLSRLSADIRSFLAYPPLSGEAVLASRIAALAHPAPISKGVTGQLQDQAVAFAEMWGTADNWQQVRDAYISAIERDRENRTDEDYHRGFQDAKDTLSHTAGEIEAGGESDRARLAAEAFVNVEMNYATLIARAEAADKRIAELTEQAFRDGVAYATNCEVTDVDLAWSQSRVRAALEPRQ